MTIEEISKAGIAVSLDLADLRLLREVLLSFDPDGRKWEPMKGAAFSAMGAAFHAAAVACENMPEGRV